MDAMPSAGDAPTRTETLQQAQYTPGLHSQRLGITLRTPHTIGQNPEEHHRCRNAAQHEQTTEDENEPCSIRHRVISSPRFAVIRFDARTTRTASRDCAERRSNQARSSRLDPTNVPRSPTTLRQRPRRPRCVPRPLRRHSRSASSPGSAHEFPLHCQRGQRADAPTLRPSRESTR